ncbi:hypothetical protein ABNF65_21740 [Paenibacillus larvae]
MGYQPYKKWWFWVIVVAFIFIFANLFSDKRPDPLKTISKTTIKPGVTPTVTPTPPKQAPSQTPVATSKPTPNPKEAAKGDIKLKAERYIRDYKETSIKEIQINEHMGTDDPDDYIVLVHLKFDRENTAWGAKGILGVYADDLAAHLADQKNVTEVTVFWEVPYLKNGANIAKFNYTRKGDKMKWINGMTLIYLIRRIEPTELKIWDI